MKKTLLLLLTITLSVIANSQTDHPKFRECLGKSPDHPVPFCLHDDIGLVEFLQKENITIKYRTDDWLFVTATPKWIDDNQKNGNIKQFYFEYAPPQLLNDTTRLRRSVDPVHSGTGGLSQAYTGANVVVGIIDQAIDFNHPDFQDANGNTRVMRIWDQAVSGGANPCMPYGYGLWWDSTSIDNGTCTHTTGTYSHGTSVSGIAAGNGLANGTNKGMAPNSKIVFVNTDLSSPTWTLTVADACDFIFKYADSIGLPAVINLSAGSYWGSHDGNDPATQAVEQMLDAKGGRIMVHAAGNAGSYADFHLKGTVLPDTSFVWFKNNNGVFGSSTINANTVIFDLWADTADAHFDYAFEMDEPVGYSKRGETIFRNALDNLNTTVYDTIWNGNNRIATLEVWTEIVGDAYNMFLYMTNVDSTSYLCRFKTKGTGVFDLWSGHFNGQYANDMVTVLPSSTLVPEIGNYQQPDSLQSVVSYFNCSEKVISVGNFRNRYNYINSLGNPTAAPTINFPDYLSSNSSKGPSRNNVVKPDVSAGGDCSLTAFPLWYLTDPSKAGAVDQGGWHARNNGTSMASPVVAGIAALYLEKCPTASYSDFKHDLIATATSDAITGTVPNYGYGYGRPHALNLLLGGNNIPVVGGPSICATPADLSTDTYSSIDSVVWSTGLNAEILSTATPADYSATVYYGTGCVAYTDTLSLIQGQVLSNPVITNVTSVLTSDVQANYQWALNGVDISGATSQVYTATPPFGVYTVSVTSVDGCVSVSNSIDLAAAIHELELFKGAISPNPTTSDFSIKMSDEVLSLKAFDINGKEVSVVDKGGQVYSVSHLKTGSYYLKIETVKGLFHSKIVKM